LNVLEPKSNGSSRKITPSKKQKKGSLQELDFNLTSNKTTPHQRRAEHKIELIVEDTCPTKRRKGNGANSTQDEGWMTNQSKLVVQTTDAETENEKGIILKKTSKAKFLVVEDVNSMTT